jgi:hypothetical protein
MKVLQLYSHNITIPLDKISMVRLKTEDGIQKCQLIIFGDFPEVEITYDDPQEAECVYKTIVAGLVGNDNIMVAKTMITNKRRNNNVV